MAKSKKLSDKELLELGKKLEQFYQLGYVNKKQALIFTFYKGIASGLGALIGSTIVISLVIWILSIFGHVSIIGHYIESLDHTIQR